MKIGFITDNYPLTPAGPVAKPGGIGTYTRLVGMELARRGWEVHAFTPARVKRVEPFDDGPVRVWQCPMWARRREMPWKHALAFTRRYGRRGANLHRYAILAAAEQASQDGPFEVIEIPDIGALGELVHWEGLARRFAMRLHGSIRDHTTEPYEKIKARLWSGPMHEAQRHTLLGADVVTAPTTAAIEGARRIYESPLEHARVIGNPAVIPDDLPEAAAPHECSAVLFGRLFQIKGVDLLAKAVPLVRRELPDFHVTFIGPALRWKKDGRDWADMIREIAHEAGVADAVTIRPPEAHEELMRSVRRHAIAVLPSRWETFGLTFLEAMAWEMPCVVTDIPAFRELATDGVHCLFASREDEHDLARKIIHLLRDRSLQQSLATQAREHARHWRVERIVDELVAAWTGEAVGEAHVPGTAHTPAMSAG